ncbi:MAG: leucine-rich repeat domain-containing protein [Defluviitaleaceae bacterium]|nr:leucine-rich repeat domain-containing protein [Defluviitaleaceae bacterium]
MKKLRFILAALVASVALAACGGGTPPEQYTESYVAGYFEHRQVAGGVEIIGYMGEGEQVHIPATINNMPVVSIGETAFLEAGITGVHVPYSVTNIGRSAFSGNPNLTAVTLENDTIAVGRLIHFNGIFWRVLDVQGGMAKIISEDILKELPYHREDVDITWENSYIRGYLNNEFLSTFEGLDRDRIVLTNVVNDDNPLGGDGGNDTRDYIFLLSIDEVLHFFAEPMSGSAFITFGRGSNQTWREWWWLRSPGSEADHAANVDPDGGLFEWGDDVPYYVGIRPVMWIEIDR